MPQSLLPHGPRHHFVFYGDSCSGIPGQRHEATFAAVNSVVSRLTPKPQFILFLGDEIAGLTASKSELQAQWRHWLQNEMKWLDRQSIPLWHATGNHTTYDTMSETLFQDVLGMPHNGPPGQNGLSFWVRREDLLLVFVNTLWSGLGGEGHVETNWLHAALREHEDARYKLVIGHHPIHPVNGFSGLYQREVGPEHAAEFWNLLVRERVTAYLCSHILAFDVQVHRNVLQICSAGAGTAHRMPDGFEYLHAVQAALDGNGLRYQVLDIDGKIRERLSWPVDVPPSEHWRLLPTGRNATPLASRSGDAVVFHFGGQSAPASGGRAQTLLSAFQPGTAAPLWIGFRGLDQRLTVIIGPEPRRSPHYWIGPPVATEAQFSFELLFHPGMGPGGVVCRFGSDPRWSSLQAASPWGPERLVWPDCSSVGHGQSGDTDRPFRGLDLAVRVAILDQV